MVGSIGLLEFRDGGVQGWWGQGVVGSSGW